MEIRFRPPFENQGTTRGRAVTARQTSSCGTVTVTADDGDGGTDPGNGGTDPGNGDGGTGIPGGDTALIGGGALLAVVVLLLVLQ